MNLERMNGAELVAEYNRLAPKAIKRFATKEAAIARIKELRSRKYPLKANPYHAMNPLAKDREHREVIEMVFSLLKDHAVADPNGKG